MSRPTAAVVGVNAAQDAAAAASPTAMAPVAWKNAGALAVKAMRRGVGADPTGPRDLIAARMILSGRECTMQIAREALDSVPGRYASATGTEETLPLAKATCSVPLPGVAAYVARSVFYLTLDLDWSANAVGLSD